MSSDDGHSTDEHSNPSARLRWDGDVGPEERARKKRKGRACDTCRRRKVKCDGTEDSMCTNCDTAHTKCTYADHAKRRAPIHPDYVDSLKRKIRKLEGLLTELFPNANIQDEDITADDLRRSLLQTEASLPVATTDSDNSIGRPPEVAISNTEDSTTAESDYIFWPRSGRYHGQSSGITFLVNALNINKESGDSSLTLSDLRNNPRLSVLTKFEHLETMDRILASEPPCYTFPPEELMSSLISLFFTHVNPLLPILHRPSFDSLYHAQLHTQDPDFANILLAVCALGSRYSNDIRVLPSDHQALSEDDSKKWHFAGIEYFVPVYRNLGRPAAHAPTLFDLQKFALSCLYLLGSNTSTYSWAFIGFGIRLALEAGANRKKKGESLGVQSQLWNRAFWALVILDRLASASTGRPWAVQDEDIDVDLPIAVDDEYWDPPDPNDAWKQPAGKPAITEHPRSMIKLLEILAFALRTLYSTNKSKLMLGLVGPSWEQRVVAEIDSALNKWVDSMPDHLRWNPHQENTLFLNQSAFLNCLYYHVQTFVHRPFIIKHPSSPLSFPSLAICTNAARSSSHILEIQRQKGGTLPIMITCAFSSGIILMLNIWAVNKLGAQTDSRRHMQDVFTCMDWLKAYSKRWVKAQSAWHILDILLSAGDLPHPQSGSLVDGGAGMKRSHDSDSHLSQGESWSFTSKQLAIERTDGLNHVHHAKATTDTVDETSPSVLGSIRSPSIPQMDRPFTCADLGVLPLYPELYGGGVIDTMQPSSLTGELSYNSTPHTGTSDEANTQNIPGSASFSWLEMAQRASSATPVASTSTDFGQHLHDTSLLGANVDQLFISDQEMFLGHDTLSMWATAPTSFEAHEWGEFAQEFLLNEQYESQSRCSGAGPPS